MPGGAKPAELLLGLQVDDGWTVTKSLAATRGSSGGNFSCSYLVERPARNGGTEEAFLKALDLTMAQNLGMPIADALQYVTQAYIHERDLVMECATRRMRNVVTGLSSGQVTINDTRVDPRYAFFTDVPYIVFECAQADIRSALESGLVAFDVAWSLRVMHGTANGIRQLHSFDMAHQDLKPSNVMAFDAVAKVGDLGRSSPAGGSGMFDHLPIPGDRSYAPPELLYREIQPDDRVRRRAADMYQLGSLIAFLFSGAVFTALWEAELDPAFHWRTWPRTYQNALPYVRQAFDQAFLGLSGALPAGSRAELVSVMRELCDPDPMVRGNPRAGTGPQRYDLQRYVSIFDRLARSTEIALASATTP